MGTEIIERWQFKSARTLGGSGGKRSNSATSPRSVGLLLTLLDSAVIIKADRAGLSRPPKLKTA